MQTSGSICAASVLPSYVNCLRTALIRKGRISRLEKTREWGGKAGSAEGMRLSPIHRSLRFDDRRDGTARMKGARSRGRERKTQRARRIVRLCFNERVLVSISEQRFELLETTGEKKSRPRDTLQRFIKARATARGRREWEGENGWGEVPMKSFTWRLRKVSTADRGTKKPIFRRGNKRHFGI